MESNSSRLFFNVTSNLKENDSASQLLCSREIKREHEQYEDHFIKEEPITDNGNDTSTIIDIACIKKEITEFDKEGILNIDIVKDEISVKQEHDIFNNDADTTPPEIEAVWITPSKLENVEQILDEIPSTPPFFQCSICDELFLDDSGFLKHLQNHAQLKCNICGLMFSEDSHLLNHMNELQHKLKRRKYLTNERVKAYNKRKYKRKPDRPPPKTDAERAKAYRERKKQRAMASKQTKTDAERAKAYRDRKKQRNAIASKQTKTDAERSKAYRERKKQIATNASQQPTTSGLPDFPLKNKAHEENYKSVTPNVTLNSEIIDYDVSTVQNPEIKRDLEQYEDHFFEEVQNTDNGNDTSTILDTGSIEGEITEVDEEGELNIDLEKYEMSVKKVQELLNIDAENITPEIEAVWIAPVNTENVEQMSNEIPSTPNFKCSICDKLFPDNSRLMKHLQNHTKLIKCNICGLAFTQNSHLLNHMNVHTVEISSQRDNLENHQRIHTTEKSHPYKNNVKKKVYKCDICEKTFSQGGHLFYHKKIHTGEKPYQCNECGKSFARKGHFDQHQRTHTGEKPYTCDECGKMFTAKSSLVTHKMIHANCKPYKCDECDKTFRHKSALTYHKKIHSGEKPHKCDECGKTYRQKSNLISHKKFHEGVIF